MTTISRYDIYLADLNPTIGSEIKKVRPVVVVSRNEMNRYLETVVVCPLTTRLHPRWRSRLQVECAGKNTEIAVDQIRTISRQRLSRKIDELSEAQAARLRALITEMYGE
ncbi:type II toxin-antitoxin system PemK/MazF family toxin [Desulfonatronum thiodismutans]|uniref:type II toxin-antitoxin system PemK/MazF family toxin n=1 Tax=Desulfonatronum thiodismutans TaxID=159290 RepID=UPI0004ABD4B9|nr:type II toxin-antitoxin system PemK/MazF family toxin [Desulfonatronum thiodismutans]